MALEKQTEMTQSDTDALLGRHETGVLSLARDDDPYAIPISYGYDADDRTFYLRLVSTPESEKREFLSSNPDARLVVYEEDEPTYKSVVVTGTLTEISRDEMTVEHVEQYGEAKRPLFEIWGEAKPDLDIKLYELRADTISGRHIELSERHD
ncbi:MULTISPECIES: pyridoxamine 5'-phosphate oxidase family protein [unclassified Halobacterium]|jgi:nitroimidazol reductase NimA-like FMN-containing flavoprotein (pyridoxamine 5'-phosphate oxidase superfamily)|uniref:pyridoxamine 5'-phosphate oxidase family protein n=1 Tax=unclassified Halobacterium TaxID=2668073 RepID=UPI001E5FE5D4|nr:MULTISPECIES: pyridoxamine 5'-phosphate oxidase family protein [unclassified Halobacterium]MCD2199838.1 pyridoxamine 5'-phosphate oxidase family protein [Halobacterium sp. KA-4]MCD2204190.1 pyridoxamine 5'-phosphate oxidase family protein [Halobacterium sp. KA-6]